MSATESAAARHQMGATLQSGLRVVSEDQTIEFTRYVRLVLPVDGFVFWVRADRLGPSALFNTSPYNTAEMNQGQSIAEEAATFRANGSIHYMTQAVQAEDDGSSVNRVVFTSEEEIKNLNAVRPDVMWMGEWQGMRFAFSQRGMFYEQAKLWHYAGDAVLAAMSSQIIDNPVQFDGRQIVSNSLPLWLGLRAPYLPVLGLNGLEWPLFPSFAVPQNQAPPYVSVHVFPDSTSAIAAAPSLDATRSQSQLVRERVRLTTYGLRNDDVLNLCDYVQQAFALSEQMGIMNMPAPRDSKRTQVEMAVLAQRKEIDYEVNYNQYTARQIARQMVVAAVMQIDVQPVPPLRPGLWDEFRWDDGTTWGGDETRWDEFNWDQEAWA